MRPHGTPRKSHSLQCNVDASACGATVNVAQNLAGNGRREQQVAGRSGQRPIEDEHLDGHVGIEVVVAHQCDDAAARQLLHTPRELFAHRALKQPTRIASPASRLRFPATLCSAFVIAACSAVTSTFP